MALLPEGGGQWSQLLGAALSHRYGALTFGNVQKSIPASFGAKAPATVRKIAVRRTAQVGPRCRRWVGSGSCGAGREKGAGARGTPCPPQQCSPWRSLGGSCPTGCSAAPTSALGLSCPIPPFQYISCGPSSFASSHHTSLLLQVFYNNKGYHSMPTYLNALNNAILRANLPKSKGNPAAYGEDLETFKGRSTSGTDLVHSPNRL